MSAFWIKFTDGSEACCAVSASGGAISEEIFSNGFNDGTTGGWR